MIESKSFLRMFLLSLIVFFLLGCCVVDAHSPQSMQLDYDTDTQQLTVSITHQVADPNQHYIFVLVLEKNGEEYDTIDYSSQPSSNQFTYTFTIPAEVGDTLKAIAECNQGGSINQQITLTEEGQTTEPDTSTPGFELGFLFLILLFFFLFKRR